MRLVIAASFFVGLHLCVLLFVILGVAEALEKGLRGRVRALFKKVALMVRHPMRSWRPTHTKTHTNPQTHIH